MVTWRISEWIELLHKEKLANYTLYSANPHELTWCHLSSHDVTWVHMILHELTWCHMSSHDLTWCHMSSHDLTWAHIIVQGRAWFVCICPRTCIVLALIHNLSCTVRLLLICLSYTHTWDKHSQLVGDHTSVRLTQAHPVYIYKRQWSWPWEKGWQLTSLFVKHSPLLLYSGSVEGAPG